MFRPQFKSLESRSRAQHLIPIFVYATPFRTKNYLVGICILWELKGAKKKVYGTFYKNMLQLCIAYYTSRIYKSEINKHCELHLGFNKINGHKNKP